MKKSIGILLILLMICAFGLASAEEGVKIDWARFPDDALRIEVMRYDTDHDGILSAEEAENADCINVYGEEVETLQGIEYLTGLRELYCDQNRLTELDVSRNLKLEILYCWGNELTELDVRQNTELTHISCYRNKLTELDVSKNSKLTFLNCNWNELTELCVSENPKLEALLCTGNKLTKLDVRQNTKLTRLSCHDNQLTELDVSRNIALADIDCHRNQIAELDISKNIKLKKLSVSDNPIKKLDISMCPELKELYCSYCELTELDVSGNMKLHQLICYCNQVTKLDLRHNPKLEKVDCRDNQLTELSLGHNPELVELDCSDNQLSILDLSQIPKVKRIDCHNNKLIRLDISNCPALVKTVRENESKNRRNEQVRWASKNEDTGTSFSLDIDINVVVYTGDVNTEPGIIEDDESYDIGNDSDIWMYNIGEELLEFFYRWAGKDINAMPDSLIYEQMIGGETTMALMKTLMESGIPTSVQINQIEGDVGDDVMTFICMVEIAPGEDEACRYEQIKIRMKLEEGDYRIDLTSLMDRQPGKYDPEAKTQSLSKVQSQNDRVFKKKWWPIGVSCENNGIWMEVVSGKVVNSENQNELEFRITLDDLNGDYNDYLLDPGDCSIDLKRYYSSQSTVLSRKDHENYANIYMRFYESITEDDCMLTLKSDGVNLYRRTYTDLMPYLKQYGVTTEGIQPPDDDFPEVPGLERPQTNVLDYTNPLDIPLADSVRLIGIGWINNQLHVQIAYNMNNVEFCWIYDGMNQKDYYRSKAVMGVLNAWQEDQDLYVEHIFDYTPEEVDNLRLYAASTGGSQCVKGSWEFQFPLSWIYPGIRETEIEIDENYFPDEAFREEVALYDVNEDGKLSETEAESIISLYLRGMGIKTLKGIEYLTNLTLLDCRDNELTELDVSNNRELETIQVDGNKIEEDAIR